MTNEVTASKLRPGIRRGIALTVVAISILAVGVAVPSVRSLVFPKPPSATGDSRAVSKLTSTEAQSKHDLSRVRDAVYKFWSDTNCWPLTLSDLTATTPSALSTPSTGIDGQGNRQHIKAKGFHGPYLREVPLDAVSSSAFNYSLDPGSVGIVSSSATGKSSLGEPYSAW